MKPRQKVRSVLRKYQKLPNARPGILGNGAGLVTDSSRPGHNYVRIGNAPPISIINHRTAPIDNQKVWVGYDPLEPNILQVLSIRSVETLAWGGANPFTSTARHASSHRWFERDTVFVDLRQMMPFRPQVDGSMILQINHGLTYLGSQWMAIPDASIDMTSYVPATGAIYSLIYYADDGIHVDTSSIRDLNTLLPSDAPAPTSGTIPLALIRLWSGMSGIVENRIATDLADPRWMGLYGGVGGSSTFIDLTDVPGSYSGSSGMVVSVKGDESGLEFTTPTGGGEKVKVSASDNEADYLLEKLFVGGNLGYALNNTDGYVTYNIFLSTHDHSGSATSGSPFEVRNLITAEVDATKVLKPDGAGGITWGLSSAVPPPILVIMSRSFK